MDGDVARRFMEALQGAERTGEVGPLVEMFADDAELSKRGDDRLAQLGAQNATCPLETRSARRSSGCTHTPV